MTTLSELLHKGREQLASYRKEHQKEQEEATRTYVEARDRHWQSLLLVIGEHLPEDLWQYANVKEPPREFNGGSVHGSSRTRVFDLLLDVPGCARVQARFSWYQPEGWMLTRPQGNAWLVVLQHPLDGEDDTAAWLDYSYEEVADLSLALAMAEEEHQRQELRQRVREVEDIRREAKAIVADACPLPEAAKVCAEYPAEMLLTSLTAFIEDHIRRMPCA